MARTTPWPTEPRTVFFDDVASAPTLVKAASAGKIRRLAPRVYTADLAHPPEELIRRNWQRIVAHLIPQAVIVDRSAAHFETIASDGLLTIAADTTRQRINLPGLEIRIRLAQRQPTDTSLGSGLALSSNARILLDNLRITRGHDHKKPLALFERTIAASTKAGGIVLNPFCGCATTCIAAEKLKGQWIGIDISPKAGDLITHRLGKDLSIFSANVTITRQLPAATFWF